MPDIHFRIIATNGKPNLSQDFIHGLFTLSAAVEADLARLYALLMQKKAGKVLVYLSRKVSFILHSIDDDFVAGVILPELLEPLLGLLEGSVAREVVQ